MAKALKGELTVKEALDSAARKWEVITDELGRDKQLAIYRSSMGLSAEITEPKPPWREVIKH
ncbi:hypothetical protein [Candidatus Reidiella endopervernicosa]|uniref:Uncharacterized protein n=1 Tax=Candidatus Reidiella endopervernicosa TaxID=2738883 RepID=A0A6N0HZG6_9GAMM|nr:hypothetical protein [Candidatus Reidiella endopervernicosa]QKQ27763.1 hypothetical protein HUE57_16835 [Candidatus Reidiella endopervernicosa]